jgi:c-di-GMP-related signal transduction protein
LHRPARGYQQRDGPSSRCFLELWAPASASIKKARGVETSEQFVRLTALGVNFAQGYLLGRPVPIDEPEGQPQS